MSKMENKQIPIWTSIITFIASLTVEPIMMLDGLAYSVMVVFVEHLQMDKICLVNLNYTHEICENITVHEKENLELQQYFSYFGMYNGIIMAFLPLFFILFMGAWSDKYGRKIPLVIATFGHFFFAFGYLLNAYVFHWPVEYLLIAALMDSLGGGLVSFLTSTNSYISDVTSEEKRTSRVGFANSLWYLGGPIGTFLGTMIYKHGGYMMVFGTSLAMYSANLVMALCLAESHGPFATIKKPLKPNHSTIKEKKSISPQKSIKETEKPLDKTQITTMQMIKDLVNYRRIVDSFRSTFKKREGCVRVFILLLITCNLLRRLGRGKFSFFILYLSKHFFI